MNSIHSRQFVNTLGLAARTEGFVTVSIPLASLLNPVYSHNQMTIEVSGATNYSYVVQGSTDLVNWANFQTNAAPYLFTDSVSSNFPCRLYRAVL